MLYMKCPSCGELLADKQKYYEQKMVEIHQKYQANLYSDEEFDKLRSDIITQDFGELRYCCKTRILTYVKLVELVT
jgi:DNA-directed RNA polymerase subunit N (RpoN/RPB10)